MCFEPNSVKGTVLEAVESQDVTNTEFYPQEAQCDLHLYLANTYCVSTQKVRNAFDHKCQNI